MATPSPFLDSNTLVYWVSTDAAKASRSEELLHAGGTISVQVLNEFVNVTRRKLRFAVTEVEIFLRAIRASCEVVPVTVAVHERGLALAKAHGFQTYDAMIVAAAQLSGCEVLLSEDLQDGRVIDGLTIRNPYTF